MPYAEPTPTAVTERHLQVVHNGSGKDFYVDVSRMILPTGITDPETDEATQQLVDLIGRSAEFTLITAWKRQLYTSDLTPTTEQEGDS